MTTYLGKSCSFGLPRVPFVNCRQFMYLVISLLVLRAGWGILLNQFLIIAYLFNLPLYGGSGKTYIICKKLQSAKLSANSVSLSLFLSLCFSAEHEGTPGTQQ